MDTNQRKFAITQHKGFQMQFDNGLLVSVQFGSGNYCDTDRRESLPHNASEADCWSSNLAEVAVIDLESDDWLNPKTLRLADNGDAVIGWCRTEDVADIIHKASHFKRSSNIKKLIWKILGKSK